MRVLWFEVTVPSAYVSGGVPIGGWQDSLERIVRTIPDTELIIAFVSEKYSEVKEINGVVYVPIYTQWSFFEKAIRNYWDVYVEKMLPEACSIINKYIPDLIQVFGTEWPFGQIAAFTEIPVVIHIMGAIVPYNNAAFPPGYSFMDVLWQYWWSPRKLLELWRDKRNRKNWEQWERRTWKCVKNYMGRTQWDCSLSRVMHPGRRYFHVDEALRPLFITGNKQWHLKGSSKIRLISTGCSTFWKGPDMMLKVACILTKLGVDFEWNVVGSMNLSLKQLVENKEGVRFENCHINLLGFKDSEELTDLLCSSTLYVHTAYIENSPNSICEAQCLGVPIISTNVGGISTLVRDGIDGILVPANDPWQMADAIVQLGTNKERMEIMSRNSFALARDRHDDERIKRQLLDAYDAIINGIKM